MKTNLICVAYGQKQKSELSCSVNIALHIPLVADMRTPDEAAQYIHAMIPNQ